MKVGGGAVAGIGSSGRIGVTHGNADLPGAQWPYQWRGLYDGALVGDPSGQLPGYVALLAFPVSSNKKKLLVLDGESGRVRWSFLGHVSEIVLCNPSIIALAIADRKVTRVHLFSASDGRTLAIYHPILFDELVYPGCFEFRASSYIKERWATPDYATDRASMGRMRVVGGERRGLRVKSPGRITEVTDFLADPYGPRRVVVVNTTQETGRGWRSQASVTCLGR